MKLIFARVASILASVIGVMAIFAGGQVLLGNLPDYYVIGWLPPFNVAVGVITIIFTAVFIWKHNRLALPVTMATLGVHTIVMVVLLTVYGNVVAPDSLRATTVRIFVWIVILGLVLFQARKQDGAVKK